MNQKKVEKAYDNAAKIYHEGRMAGKHVANEFTEMPATMKLLGKVRGKKILDAGCGSGLYARRLVKKVQRYGDLILVKDY